MDFPASVKEAERLWYEVHRWPSFIEGFGEIVHVDESWPTQGSGAVWDSTPAGRGRVSERILEHRPGQGGLSEISDDRLSGTRQVTFQELAATAEDSSAVRVAVELDYRLTGSRLRALFIDRLFVRRPVLESMQRELERFGHELPLS
jgi:uncharacterized membrane protein